MQWLAAKGLFGLSRKIWVALAVIGCLFLILGIASTVRNTLQDSSNLGREAGKKGAVIQGQNQTLEQLGDANDAETEIMSNGKRSNSLYQQCLLDSRTKDSCERFKPEQK